LSAWELLAMKSEQNKKKKPWNKKKCEDLIKNISMGRRR
jgi:hypothetical protein